MIRAVGDPSDMNSDLSDKKNAHSRVAPEGGSAEQARTGSVELRCFHWEVYSDAGGASTSGQDAGEPGVHPPSEGAPPDAGPGSAGPEGASPSLDPERDFRGSASKLRT